MRAVCVVSAAEQRIRFNAESRWFGIILLASSFISSSSSSCLSGAIHPNLYQEEGSIVLLAHKRKSLVFSAVEHLSFDLTSSAPT